jgi:hypothetical protein
MSSHRKLPTKDQGTNPEPEPVAFLTALFWQLGGPQVTRVDPGTDLKNLKKQEQEGAPKWPKT